MFCKSKVIYSIYCVYFTFYLWNCDKTSFLSGLYKYGKTRLMASLQNYFFNINLLGYHKYIIQISYWQWKYFVKCLYKDELVPVTSRKKLFHSKQTELRIMLLITIEIFFSLLFITGSYLYSTEDSLGWVGALVHMSDIWKIFSCCYDFSKYSK